MPLFSITQSKKNPLQLHKNTNVITLIASLCDSGCFSIAAFHQKKNEANTIFMKTAKVGNRSNPRFKGQIFTARRTCSLHLEHTDSKMQKQPRKAAALSHVTIKVVHTI